MSIHQPTQCFSCKRELEQTVVFVPEEADPGDYVITQAVWVSPLGRQIGFCDRCYLLERFDLLKSQEIAALHWAFGRCDAEDTPELIGRKIARLHTAADGVPCREVFSALADAYSLAGRKTEARLWAAKAVSWTHSSRGVS